MMSDVNPYSTPQGYSTAVQSDAIVRKVSSNPIELIQRSYELVKDKYGLFLGITVVGILLASMVPFGIILGPMMIGVFYCYSLHASGREFIFSDSFKGFDQFLNGFLVILAIIATSLILMTPLLVLLLIGIVSSKGEPPIVLILLFYPAILLVGLLTYLPFLFVFQLMAERKLAPIEAIKLSMRGTFTNLLSVCFNLFCIMFVSFLLTCMCYIPGILFLPISTGAMFLLYKDIYGQSDMVPHGQQ